MKFYRLLSGIRALKSYSSKFMFVAFCGIHIPLLGIVAVLIATTGDDVKKTSFFLLTLGLTLFACTLTLFILHALTAPLRITQQQLAGYLESANMPALPTDLTDETGLLMRNVAALIDRQQELRSGLKAQSEEIQAALTAMEKENYPATLAAHTKTIAIAVNKQLQLLEYLGGNSGLDAA